MGGIVDTTHLFAPNPSEKQKMICALTKEALLADSLLAFINEVSVAERGVGMVGADRVKGVVVYVKANQRRADTLAGSY